jgi:predicted ATPase/DNA-binding CsgD family transcriptional regulator
MGGWVPNNLPHQLTSFIGRAHEMAEVQRLLTTTRLLTLTGAGGSGKTRLALQVAAAVLDRYPDGVWLAELSSITDPALVPRTVAAALHIPEQPGHHVSESLADGLRSKSTLLVLDNCEHLLSACAELVDSLLRACPQLRILATSREAFGIAGESSWRVPSLSLPDLTRLPALARLTEYEAVRLFIERAVAVQSAFEMTPENAPGIVQVCAHLDGIPLAIELAAARVRVLAVEQILRRLDDSFRLLTRGSRTALPRHRTLRAAMDWSHELLSGQEAIVFRRLSVFAGGWTLEAAEEICAGNGVERPEILDLLTQLVDKSLVMAETRHDEARYRLLETVRQYGQDRLHQAGEADVARRRHRDWYLALAERAEPKLHGPEQKMWLEGLEREHDNLRAALEWCKATSDGEELGLRLAAALRGFWEHRGYFAEGRLWLEGLLFHGGTAAPLLRIRALNGAGILAYRQGDYERVLVLCGEARALSEGHGDARGSAQALHFLAHVTQARGDYDGAAEMMERSVALYQEAADKWGIANSVDCLGEIARSKGDYTRAAALTEQALALYREVGEVRGAAHILHNLAYVRLHQGCPTAAAALFRESLIKAQDLKSTRDAIMGVAGLAAARAGEMAAVRVARLLGAVDALLKTAGIHLEPAEHADFQETVAAVRGRLGDEAFASAWTGGRHMTLEEAAEDALAPAAEPSEPRAGRTRESGAVPDPLTAREREVAVLVARGLTNRDIASRLVIAERTAEGHVQSVLNKLGFNSRAQIAAWAVAQGLQAGPPAGDRPR